MISKAISPIAEVTTRLLMGWLFCTSGWAKFQNLGAVVSYFESLNIPFAQWQGPGVAGIELVGGIFIMLGIFTRLSSLLLAIVMMVAIKMAKWDDIDSLTTLMETPEVLYLTLLLWLTSTESYTLPALTMIRKFRAMWAQTASAKISVKN